MTARQVFVSTMILPALLAPSPVRSIAVRAPETVVPPFVDLRGGCSFRMEAPDGNGIGALAPVPALRLGAVVTRGALSFTTGGFGGTAMAAARRSRAGLATVPRIYDVAGTARPEVFAQPAGQSSGPPPYQLMPLKAASPVYDQYVLVFAEAISATTGRIASVEFTQHRPPSARPRLRVLFDAGAIRTGCSSFPGLAVYAPKMSADRIRRFFTMSRCNWYDLAQCQRADWPRGPVLFVRQQGASYAYRWIDYDALARFQFGTRAAADRRPSGP